MTDLSQKILKFDYDKNFQIEDFYVSNSNKHILKFLKQMAKMGKNF